MLEDGNPITSAFHGIKDGLLESLKAYAVVGIPVLAIVLGANHKRTLSLWNDFWDQEQPQPPKPKPPAPNPNPPGPNPPVQKDLWTVRTGFPYHASVEKAFHAWPTTELQQALQFSSDFSSKLTELLGGKGTLKVDRKRFLDCLNEACKSAARTEVPFEILIPLLVEVWDENGRPLIANGKLNGPVLVAHLESLKELPAPSPNKNDGKDDEVPPEPAPEPEPYVIPDLPEIKPATAAQKLERKMVSFVKGLPIEYKNARWKGHITWLGDKPTITLGKSLLVVYMEEALPSELKERQLHFDVEGVWQRLAATNNFQRNPPYALMTRTDVGDFLKAIRGLQGDKFTNSEMEKYILSNIVVYKGWSAADKMSARELLKL